MENLYFKFEIYTFNDVKVNDLMYKNAEIGTIGGWDIKVVAVKAETRKEAREKLNNYPLFDCVITNEGSEKIESSEDFITLS